MQNLSQERQKRSRFRLTHERRQRLTLQLGMIFALLCAAALLWQSENTHAGISRVVEEIQAIDSARGSVALLLSSVTHAEYEQRRYALTSGQSSLEAYQDDIRQIDQRLADLEALTPRSLADSTVMHEFRHQMAEQTGQMALTVRLTGDGQFEAAQHIVDSDVGISQMEVLRQLTDKIMANATELVNVRRNDLRHLNMLSRVGLSIGVLAAIIVFFFFVRQTRALQQADARQQRQLESERDALEATVRERTTRLAELASYLQQAVEDERARLARELHDELGALLTAAKLDVARLKSRLAPGSQEAYERVEHLTQTLNKGIALKRQIIENLRPSSLSNLGLVVALEILAREFSTSAGIVVHTEIEPVELDPGSELTVYRLAQEALTNIGKYAAASDVTLTLFKLAYHAEVSVADNGVGFDLKHIPTHCHGLIGMRHRLEALGGRLEILTGPERGTRVTGTLPLGGLNKSKKVAPEGGAQPQSAASPQSAALQESSAQPASSAPPVGNDAPQGSARPVQAT